MLLYFFVGLIFKPFGEEMIVAKSVFARFDAVLLAEFYAKVGGRTAIDFFAGRVVARFTLFGFGCVPIERQCEKIEGFFDLLLINLVFVFVVGEFVQHEHIAAETEFVIFKL